MPNWAHTPMNGRKGQFKHLLIGVQHLKLMIYDSDTRSLVIHFALLKCAIEKDVVLNK